MLLPALALAKPDDATRGRRCEAAKLAAAGRYQLCLADADARAVARQTRADYARCDKQLAAKWRKAEQRADGECPTTATDLSRVQLAATRHGAAIAGLLHGPQASGVCTAPGVQFAYSYMVTNRATPFATSRSDGIVPSAPGTLTFWTAPGAYQSSDPQTNYTEVTQAVFLERLSADLTLAASEGKLHLGTYVHGLGNVFTDALTEAAQFGCALATGGWPGLLVGFSWPSYGALESAAFYATTGPPPPPVTPQTSGTIRDNILGSRQSFDALLQLLATEVVQKSGTPVELSLLTHSEGNYMLMTGLGALTQPVTVNNCLMLAADISAVSLQDGEQGEAIATTCGQVTVYYSGADETLNSSNYEFFQYHRSDYPTRLGVIGPYYYLPAPKALNPNVTGLDCSAVTVFPAVSRRGACVACVWLGRVRVRCSER